MTYFSAFTRSSDTICLFYDFDFYLKVFICHKNSGRNDLIFSIVPNVCMYVCMTYDGYLGLTLLVHKK